MIESKLLNSRFVIVDPVFKHKLNYNYDKHRSKLLEIKFRKSQAEFSENASPSHKKQSKRKSREKTSAGTSLPVI